MSQTQDSLRPDLGSSQSKDTIKPDLGKDSIKPDLGKVLLQTVPSRSGTCPFHNWAYIVCGIVALLYAVYLTDKESFKGVTTSLHLVKLHTIFQFIDDYSPFHEALETDEEFLAKVKKLKPSDSVFSTDSAAPLQNRKGEQVFTAEGLSRYDGGDGSPGLCLALLGVVYDVSRGVEYYGPGGGYSFFSGRDGSRAFVSGQFDEDGLVDDVRGLSSGDYLGLEEWQLFYEKDYKRLGVLAGRYYSESGEVTDYWKELQGWLEDARMDRDKTDVEKQMFPPCNVEWSQAEGSRFWCTKRSGGVSRDWVGVPRQLFYPGREARCACVRTKGPPSTDPGDKTSNRGDQDSPHLREYEGCPVGSWECRSKGK